MSKRLNSSRISAKKIISGFIEKNTRIDCHNCEKLIELINKDEELKAIIIECDNAQEKIIIEKTCPKCEKQWDDTFKRCPMCGEFLEKWYINRPAYDTASKKLEKRLGDIQDYFIANIENCSDEHDHHHWIFIDIINELEEANCAGEDWYYNDVTYQIMHCSRCGKKEKREINSTYYGPM